MKFRFDCGRCFFESHGLAIVCDRASSSQFRLQWNDEIVNNRFARNWLEQSAADRIDPAVSAEQRPQPAFTLLEERLIFPIQTVGILPRFRVLQHESAANGANSRIRKPTHD